jgi:hypothetical protein
VRTLNLIQVKDVKPTVRETSALGVAGFRLD